MTTADISDAVPVKIEFLKSSLRWAFPHWTLWVMVLIIAAVDAVWLGVSQRITTQEGSFAADIFIATLAFFLIALRALKPWSFNWFFHRIWALVLSILMTMILMGDLQMLSHLLMSTSLPMADDLLMAWDRNLGLDWLAYAKMLTVSPTITEILFFVYLRLSLNGLAAIAIISILLNHRMRTIEVFFLMIVTCLTCITISAWFPARATMDLLADDELRTRMSLLGRDIGVIHIKDMMSLRGSAPLYLDPQKFQGLVSFPSFHVCMAFIVAWCSRGLWYVNILGGLIGLIIVLGTPVFGGHYFVDLIAGAIVSIISIWLWRSFLEKKLGAIYGSSLKLPQA